MAEAAVDAVEMESLAERSVNRGSLSMGKAFRVMIKNEERLAAVGQAAKVGLESSCNAASWAGVDDFFNKLHTNDGGLRSQIVATALKTLENQSPTFSASELCTAADILIQTRDGTLKAVRPVIDGFDNAVDFWTNVTDERLSTVNWIDSEGASVDYGELSPLAKDGLASARVAKVEAIEACRTGRARADTQKETVSELSKRIAGETVEARDSRVETSDDLIGWATYVDDRMGPEDQERGHKNARTLGAVVESGVGQSALTHGGLEAPLRNYYANEGHDISAMTVQDVQAVNEGLTPEAREAIRGTWGKWIGGGLAAALRYAFKDLLLDGLVKQVLAYQFAAIVELILVFCAVDIWGPNLVRELNRFLMSLSTCAMLTTGASARTYSFACAWSLVADDNQFKTNAAGAWCGAPDCFRLCSGSIVNSPAQWGPLRDPTNQYGGGGCSSADPQQLSCTNVTGEEPLCPVARAVVGGYVWQTFGLGATVSALVHGGENLVGGLSGWFGRNGWLLLAGILMLFIVIIPLVTHFISSI